jgi:hypothetical protein
MLGFLYRIIKISTLKRLLLRGKESDKECFPFQGLLPLMKYKMRC